MLLNIILEIIVFCLTSSFMDNMCREKKNLCYFVYSKYTSQKFDPCLQIISVYTYQQKTDKGLFDFCKI